MLVSVFTMLHTYVGAHQLLSANTALTARTPHSATSNSRPALQWVLLSTYSRSGRECPSIGVFTTRRRRAMQRTPNRPRFPQCRVDFSHEGLHSAQLEVPPPRSGFSFCTTGDGQSLTQRPPPGNPLGRPTLRKWR